MNEKPSVPGTADELAEIYDKYFADVYKFVYRKIPHRQMAEDITQDTFCAAVETGSKFLNHPEPRRWLFRTARNKMLELYKKMNRWVIEPLDEEMPELARESDYGVKELELTALSVLSREEWEIIKRYYLLGDTATELARSAGITENNLRVRIFRMKKKLRDEMK